MNRTKWIPAYIGIGSNLESPIDQAKTAIQELGGLESSRLVSVSGLYRSPPLCGRDQPDYVNAVAGLLTTRPAEELLKQLQLLEDRQGRQRTGEKWASRTLDLDLLAYGNEYIATSTLTVPHPGIAERIFVLLPWREIAPEFVVPGLSPVRQMADIINGDSSEIERLTV